MFKVLNSSHPAEESLCLYGRATPSQRRITQDTRRVGFAQKQPVDPAMHSSRQLKTQLLNRMLIILIKNKPIDKTP